MFRPLCFGWWGVHPPGDTPTPTCAHLWNRPPPLKFGKLREVILTAFKIMQLFPGLKYIFSFMGFQGFAWTWLLPEWVKQKLNVQKQHAKQVVCNMERPHSAHFEQIPNETGYSDFSSLYGLMHLISAVILKTTGMLPSITLKWNVYRANLDVDAYTIPCSKWKWL